MINDELGDLSQFDGHIRGPWSIEENDIFGKCSIKTELICVNGLVAWFTLATIELSDDQTVGYTEGTFDDFSVQQNARLIAAAPLLLDKVKRLRVEVENLKGQVSDFVSGLS